MTFNFVFVFISNLILFGIIECLTGDQMEVKPHKEYKNLKCSYPEISSITKLRDNRYFISTNGQKYWFITESEEASDENMRDLKTMTTKWDKIDTSLYLAPDVECDHQFKDKLILVNFNAKTIENEVIVGSIADWNFTKMFWWQIQAFNVLSEQIDWQKPIDGIAHINDTFFFFQDLKQFRVDCVYSDNKWVYQIFKDFRQIPVSTAIKEAYCDDSVKDTIPLYVFRGQSLLICYIKLDNSEWPFCEESSLADNPLLPKPFCSVESDPNVKLIGSITVQIAVLPLLLTGLIVYSFIYFWNLWLDSNRDEYIEGTVVVSPTKPAMSPTKGKKTKKVDKHKK